MAAYLKQAKLYGDMRDVWARQVWWTREVMIAKANNLPSLSASATKFGKSPQVIGDVFAPFYPDRTVRKMEELLGGQKKPDEIARFFASINPFFQEAEVHRMMQEHLRLILQEATNYLNGRYEASIQAFDQIQDEAQTMADYFSRGITEQFPQAFR